MKLTKRGTVVLIAVAGVCVGVALTLLPQRLQSKKTDKTLQWEYLESKEGMDLNRLPLPNGWLVECDEGYMVTIDDPEHEWLEDQDQK